MNFRKPSLVRTSVVIISSQQDTVNVTHLYNYRQVLRHIIYERHACSRSTCQIAQQYLSSYNERGLSIRSMQEVYLGIYRILGLSLKGPQQNVGMIHKFQTCKCFFCILTYLAFLAKTKTGSIALFSSDYIYLPISLKCLECGYYTFKNIMRM